MHYNTIQHSIDYLNKRGIPVTNEEQKNKLTLIGGTYGIKQYSYYKTNRIQYKTVDEIWATVTYDRQLKSLLYGPLMQSETIFKTIVLDSIYSKYQIEYTEDLFAIAFKDEFHLSPDTNQNLVDRDVKLKNDLKAHINERIRTKLNISEDDDSPEAKTMIKEFPVSKLFQILTLGEFVKLLECLNDDFREYIAKQVEYNDVNDSMHVIIYTYPKLVKKLRNPVAHGGIIFDVRFDSSTPSKPSIRTLLCETKLQSVNFKHIGDYVLLLIYILKLAGVDRQELLDLLDNYIDITRNYRSQINEKIQNMVIQKDIEERVKNMKSFVNS